MIAERPNAMGSPLFAFAGGGTGGHLYPAIAIAGAVREQLPEARFVFFGTERAIDRQILEHVEAELVPQGLPRWSAKPWHWVGIYRGLRGSFQECRSRLEADPPAVVIATGGMASVPAAREASRAGIPVAVFNPDALPGKANRLIGRWTRVVFAQWPATTQHFPAGTDVRVVGCPVRPAFHNASREAGLSRFGLRPDRRTLLVTGASQGAQSINEAVLANLALLETHPEWQILHLTGQNDHARVEAAYAGRSLFAAVRAYTENMAEALAAADLVVARAGASTLAELTAVGRASILMPYPHHRDQHQLANALCLSESGAARIVRDSAEAESNARALRNALADLLPNHSLRGTMANAARRLGRTGAAQIIAEEVLRIARHSAFCGTPESVETPCLCTR